MTPEQALDLIDNVLAQVNAPREHHRQILEAVAVLREAVGSAAFNGQIPASPGPTG